MKNIHLLVIVGLVLLGLGSCSRSTLSEATLRAYIEAKIAYEHGDFVQAKSALSVLLKKHPDFFQARFLRAKIEFFTNKLKASQVDLQRVVNEHSDHLQARFWLALVDVQTGRVDAAIHRIDDLLALDPQDYRLLYERGLLYLKKGDVKNALDFFHQATLDEADLAKPRLEAGRIFFGLGDSSKALQELQRARVLVGDHSALTSTIDTLIKTVQATVKKVPLSEKKGPKR